MWIVKMAVKNHNKGNVTSYISIIDATKLKAKSWYHAQP